MSFNIAVGSHYEVRVYCYHNASKQLAINAFKYTLFSSDSSQPIPSLLMAQSFSAEVHAAYKALLDSGSTFLGVSIQDFPARVFVASWTKLHQGAGTVVGADVPTQVSGLIQWRTNNAGPKGRGRTYIPFPSTVDSTAAGAPTADYVSRLDLLAAIMAPQIEAITGGINYIARMKINDAEGLGAYKEIVTRKGVGKWASQRRRGNYGRLNDIPVELV